MATATSISTSFHHAPKLQPRRRLLRPVSSSYKVAILGAGNEVGRPLSLLVNMSPLVKSLNLYDAARPEEVGSVAESLSHCNTSCRVRDFTKREEEYDGVGDCVDGADVVVVVLSSRLGQRRHDEDGIETTEVREVGKMLMEMKRKALVHIVSDKVDYVVPMVAEVLKKKGVYDPNKLFGVTTLDVIRASTFVARKKDLRMMDVDVPVVGGKGGVTTLPLLSKMRPCTSFTEEEAMDLTTKVQTAEEEVAKAKGRQGSATLSTAYATARFIESSLRALDGEENVYECAFTESSLTELPFLASRVRLGRQGLKEVVKSDFEGMSRFEEDKLATLKPVLMTRIQKGIAAAGNVFV